MKKQGFDILDSIQEFINQLKHKSLNKKPFNVLKEPDVNANHSKNEFTNHAVKKTNFNQLIKKTNNKHQVDDSIIDVTNNPDIPISLSLNLIDEEYERELQTNRLIELSWEKWLNNDNLRKNEPNMQIKYIDDVKLGDKYKSLLNLNIYQIYLLNHFTTSHAFWEIEGCCVETIKLYLKVIQELNKLLKNKNQDFTTLINYIDEKIYSQKEYLRLENISLSLRTIFFRAEAAVRQSFEYNIKISTELPVTDLLLKNEFEEIIGNYVDVVINQQIPFISQPDELTEILLNEKKVKRWETRFDRIKATWNREDNSKFILDITNLCFLNKKNKNINLIYNKIGAFLEKYNSILPIQLYAHQLYLLKKTYSFSPSFIQSINIYGLPIYVRKQLDNDDKFEKFKNILSQLFRSNDCVLTFKQISECFNDATNKRRSIKIDNDVVKKARIEHQSTIELLNQYLGEEQDLQTNTILAYNVNANHIAGLNITSSEINLEKCLSNLTQVQLNMMDLFVYNKFLLPVSDVDSFAKKNNLLSNALINAINELCYDFLEDNLIYQENETYYMEKDYYDRVIQCK